MRSRAKDGWTANCVRIADGRRRSIQGEALDQPEGAGSDVPSTLYVWLCAPVTTSLLPCSVLLLLPTNVLLLPVICKCGDVRHARRTEARPLVDVPCCCWS